jgi:hypothetical protein
MTVLADRERKCLMNAHKLRVEALEDRSVPSATLITQDLVANAPVKEAVSVVTMPDVPLAKASVNVNGQSGSNGKIATNHNETLVRDRSGRKPRRR